MMFCEVVVPRSNHARDVPVLQVLLVSCQELLAAKGFWMAESPQMGHVLPNSTPSKIAISFNGLV